MRIDVATGSDMPFVMRSWLMSWRHSEVTRTMPGDAYYDWQRKRIDGLLPRCVVLVARPDDWDQGILGWLCGEVVPEGSVVHYVYVKRRSRREGIATALLQQLVDTAPAYAFTHRRHPYHRWLESRGFVHRPKLARSRNESRIRQVR